MAQGSDGALSAAGRRRSGPGRRLRRARRPEARRQPADGERASQDLSQAGLLRAKRLKQWTFYKRDERRIKEIKRAIIKEI